MLQDFDSELDVARTNRLVVRTEVSPVIDTVEVTRTGHARPEGRSKEYLDLPGEEWTWQAVRDYVVTQIEQRFGMFPRDSLKMTGIFKRFVATWGPQAITIARFAFEIEGGYWLNQPVTVTRFCRGQDKFFAEPIAQKLLDARRPA